MNNPRYRHSSMIWKDHLYVMFGESQEGVPEKSIERFDLKNMDGKF